MEQKAVKKKLSTKSRNRWDSFFKALDSSWARFLIISGILVAGFRGGMYLQETRMLRAETEKERLRIVEMREMIEQWTEQESLLRSEIDNLKLENGQLKMRLLRYEENSR